MPEIFSIEPIAVVAPAGRSPLMNSQSPVAAESVFALTTRSPPSG